jgi:hypothetical protein
LRLLARAPAVDETLDELEVELGVAVAGLEPERLAVRVARVLEPPETEERVAAVVLRDRAQVRRGDVDRVRTPDDLDDASTGLYL